MILQLKQSNGAFPNGGWPFKDAKTGFKCNGWEGTPHMHAAKIIRHRRGVPQFYPSSESHWFDINSIVQEIYAQKAQTHPHLFRGFPDAMPQPVQKAVTMSPPTNICACGSSEWDPIYCLTCGGHKVKGYKCRQCKKELKK